MSRPNIVVIMSDEHDPYVTGCGGNRFVDTPNIDRMAAHGVRFDNAYRNSVRRATALSSILGRQRVLTAQGQSLSS